MSKVAEVRRALKESGFIINRVYSDAIDIGAGEYFRRKILIGIPEGRKGETYEALDIVRSIVPGACIENSSPYWAWVVWTSIDEGESPGDYSEGLSVKDFSRFIDIGRGMGLKVGSDEWKEFLKSVEREDIRYEDR